MARGPAGAGICVEHKTVSPFKSRPESRIVERIFGAAIAIRAGHIGEHAAIGQTHQGSLFAHALVEPHGSTQRFGRVGQVAREDVRIDRGGDTVEVHRGKPAHTEFLLVAYGGHHDVRYRDRDGQDQSTGYDRNPHGQRPRPLPHRRQATQQDAPISTVCFMRLDGRLGSRRCDMSGNLNVRLRTLFVMSNAARAVRPELIDMMPSGSLRGRYRTNPSCIAGAFFVRRSRVPELICLASPCPEVILSLTNTGR
jgi:hypothetical protein